MGIAHHRWLRRVSTSSYIYRTCLHHRTRASAAQKKLYSDRVASSINTSDHPDHALDHQDDQKQTLKPLPKVVKDLFRATQQSTFLGPDALELTFLRAHLESHEIDYARQRREANVSDASLVGELMIDREDNVQDAKAWTEILRYRRRVDRDVGVREVWIGMQLRNFELPVTGIYADELWSTLIQSHISDERTGQNRRKTANEIIAHAVKLKEKHNLVSPSLHRALVGGWFGVSPNMAGRWHEKLISLGLAPDNALKLLSEDILAGCKDSRQKVSAFLDLTRGIDDRFLYDHVIPQVLARYGPQGALIWHQVLLNRSDVPSHVTFQREDVQAVFSLDNDLSLPVIHRYRKLAGKDELPKAKDFPVLTRSLMSQIVGDVHGIKERTISDSFIARLLATRAVSLELILKAISILGVDHIDAVGVRELALRCRGPEEYIKHVAGLTSSGVNVGAVSKFVSLLSTLARDNNHDLFHALINSDQHPDNFEDAQLQTRLKEKHVIDGDSIKANLSHEALLIISRTGRTAAWNMDIQYGIQDRRWELVRRAIGELQANSLDITHKTLDYIDKLVVTSTKSKEDNEDVRDIIDLATNAYLYADEVNGNVLPLSWIALLKRHGRVHRWDQIEKIASYLAGRFEKARATESLDSQDDATGIAPASFYLDPSDYDTPHPGRWRTSSSYHAVFTEEMLKALFVWGYRAAAKRSGFVLTEPLLLDELETGTQHIQGTIDSLSSVTNSGKPKEDNSFPQNGVKNSGIHEWPLDTRSREASQTLKIPDNESSHLARGKNFKKWDQGLLLLLHIRKSGISVPTELVRKVIIDVMWTLYGPGKSNVKLNRRLRQDDIRNLEACIMRAENLWDGELFPGLSEYQPKDNTPGSWARFLVYLFGTHRRASARSKDKSDVAAWANHVCRNTKTFDGG